MRMRWVLVVAALAAVGMAVSAGGQPEDEPPPQVQIGEAQLSLTESPLLTEMVGRGELPPLEDRIPSDPQVISVQGSLGGYGGRLRSLAPDPEGNYAEFGWLNTHGIAQYDEEFNLVPTVFSSWDMSEDYRVFTFFMREGMKWSDGHPFTTRDVQFWYEDIILNEELTPTLPLAYAPGGALFELEIVDQYRFRMRFAEPYPRFIDFLHSAAVWAPYHHLRQFHTNYSDTVADLAAEEGYDNWRDLFEAHAETGVQQTDMDTPVLNTWVLEEVDSAGNRYYVRNPYFFKVDEAGRQLPYIDYFDRILVENNEVLNARVISGDTTHASWFVTMANYPLLKSEEVRGGYTAGLYPDARASEFGFVFNYTHQDPVLREIFNDIRWRQAVSHAINREEMNEIQFLGQGIPRQPIMDPGASFYAEGIDQYYVEYDVVLANRLLDEMGLEWDSEGQWRLRPDGRPIRVNMEFWAGRGTWAQSGELIKGYWEDIGVDLSLTPRERGLYQSRLLANESDMGVWAIGGSSEAYSRQADPIRYRPPWHWPENTPLGGVRWWEWYESGGARGEEPPPEIQRLYDVVDEWLDEPRGSERYLELGREMLQINAENAWLIGTIGLVPRVAVFDNRLRNTPAPGSLLSVEYGMYEPYRAEQWFFGE